jgi:hypothetical protein
MAFLDKWELAIHAADTKYSRPARTKVLNPAIPAALKELLGHEH